MPVTSIRNCNYWIAPLAIVRWNDFSELFFGPIQKRKLFFLASFNMVEYLPPTIRINMTTWKCISTCVLGGFPSKVKVSYQLFFLGQLFCLFCSKRSIVQAILSHLRQNKPHIYRILNILPYLCSLPNSSFSTSRSQATQLSC
jgi:hypothetical protein